MSLYLSFTKVTINHAPQINESRSKNTFHFIIFNDKFMERVKFTSFSNGRVEKKEKIGRNVFVLPDYEKLRVKIEENISGDKMNKILVQKDFKPWKRDNSYEENAKIFKEKFVIESKPWEFVFSYQIKRQERAKFVGHFNQVLSCQIQNDANQRRRSSISVPKFMKVNKLSLNTKFENIPEEQEKNKSSSNTITSKSGGELKIDDSQKLQRNLSISHNQQVANSQKKLDPISSEKSNKLSQKQNHEVKYDSAKKDSSTKKDYNSKDEVIDQKFKSTHQVYTSQKISISSQKKTENPSLKKTENPVGKNKSDNNLQPINKDQAQSTVEDNHEIDEDKPYFSDHAIRKLNPKFYKGACKSKNMFSCLDCQVSGEEISCIQPVYE